MPIGALEVGIGRYGRRRDACSGNAWPAGRWRGSEGWRGSVLSCRGRRDDVRQENHGNNRTGSRKPVNLGNAWHTRRCTRCLKEEEVAAVPAPNYIHAPSCTLTLPTTVPTIFRLQRPSDIPFAHITNNPHPY